MTERERRERIAEALEKRTVRRLPRDWQKGRNCPECGSMADRPKCLFAMGSNCPRHDPDAYDPTPYIVEPDPICAEAAALLREPVGEETARTLERRAWRDGYEQAARLYGMSPSDTCEPERAEPVGGPVGYRWRFQYKEGVWSGWKYVDFLPPGDEYERHDANGTPLETQPLYAAPPAAPGAQEPEREKDAAEEALDDIAWLLGCPSWDYHGQVVRDVVMAVGLPVDVLRLRPSGGVSSPCPELPPDVASRFGKGRVPPTSAAEPPKHVCGLYDYARSQDMGLPPCPGCVAEGRIPVSAAGEES